MIVADASVVVQLITGAATPTLWDRVGTAESIHVPHLLDAEVVNSLRRLASHKKLSQDRAFLAFNQFRDLSLERYPYRAILDRVWELRPNFTAYDASYIALAEILGCPLVTCDRKLARGHQAQIEVFT